MNCGSGTMPQFQHENGQTMETWQVLECLERRAFEVQRERRANEAIGAFLQKVDSLQDQIDELRSAVEA